MRRNWIAVVLFAWALGLKALLPATAGVAQMNGVGVGASPFELCLRDLQFGAGSDDSTRQSPDRNIPHREDCLWCAASGDASGALAAAPAPLGPSLVAWVEVPWTQPSAERPVGRHSTSHQPRAPPSFF